MPIGIAADGQQHPVMRGGKLLAVSIQHATCPAWGAKDNHSNTAAFRASNGEHIMVDCALSQFSYGKLGIPMQTEDHRAIGPSDAGWKGSGLSILLDMIVLGKRADRHLRQTEIAIRQSSSPPTSPMPLLPPMWHLSLQSRAVRCGPAWASTADKIEHGALASRSPRRSGPLLAM